MANTTGNVVIFTLLLSGWALAVDLSKAPPISGLLGPVTVLTAAAAK